MTTPNDDLLAVTALDGLDDDERLCDVFGDAHWQRENEPPHNRVYLTVGAVRRLAARVQELEAEVAALKATDSDTIIATVGSRYHTPEYPPLGSEYVVVIPESWGYGTMVEVRRLR